MLIGLLILRRDGGGKFGLSHLLWKQVWRFFKLVYLFILYKGVIWIALGTATEIPPLVGLASLSFFPFLLISL